MSWPSVSEGHYVLHPDPITGGPDGNVKLAMESGALFARKFDSKVGTCFIPMFLSRPLPNPHLIYLVCTYHPILIMTTKGSSHTINCPLFRLLTHTLVLHLIDLLQCGLIGVLLHMASLSALKRQDVHLGL